MMPNDADLGNAIGGVTERQGCIVLGHGVDTWLLRIGRVDLGKHDWCAGSVDWLVRGG